MTRVLYRLLPHPEYFEPLRQEVEAVVAEEGWTKTGMDKMHKLDSFVREALRTGSGVERLLDSYPVSQLQTADDRSILFASYHDSPCVAAVHIFQWSDYSPRHARLHPNSCRSNGRTNL
jgi:hypothetical protein